MSPVSWGFWLALAAFVAAAGKFLDEYHIDKEARSKVRSVLVSLFLWLDARAVPDLGLPIWRLVKRIYSANRLLSILSALVITYWSTLTALYIARTILGSANPKPYLTYLIDWIPADSSPIQWLSLLFALSIPALAGVVFIAGTFHRASVVDNDLLKLVLLGVGMVGSVGLAVSGPILASFIAVATRHGTGYDSQSGPDILEYAAFASVLVPIAFATQTIVLICIRTLLRVVRFVALHVFNVASGPTISPFTYASSLISVLIVGIKVLQAAVT